MRAADTAGFVHRIDTRHYATGEANPNDPDIPRTDPDPYSIATSTNLSTIILTAKG
jgi:hypothetical protein